MSKKRKSVKVRKIDSTSAKQKVTQNNNNNNNNNAVERDIDLDRDTNNKTCSNNLQRNNFDLKLQN